MNQSSHAVLLSIFITCTLHTSPSISAETVIDWKGRDLPNHEYEKSTGERLGHTISRHLWKGYVYLKGRCRKGPRTDVQGQKIYNYITSYKGSKYSIYLDIKAALYSHKSAIDREYEGSRAYVTKGYVGYLPEVWSGGKVVECTGYKEGNAYWAPTNNLQQKFVLSARWDKKPMFNGRRLRWFLKTSFPQLKGAY